jgi:hypothetical protein
VGHSFRNASARVDPAQSGPQVQARKKEPAGKGARTGQVWKQRNEMGQPDHPDIANQTTWVRLVLMAVQILGAASNYRQRLR